jgi:hypothetical protein
VPVQAEEPDEGEEGTSPHAARQPVRQAGRATEAGKLAEAVVEALAMNDTAPARATLEQVIAGKLQTEGDEVKVVEVALKALAEQPTPGNEELLFRLLTESEQFREPSGPSLGIPPGRPGPAVSAQPLSAEWLRGRVLSAVEKTATKDFRVKLGVFLTQPTTPLAWRAEMGEFLLEPSPDNLDAQFVMYQSGRIEDTVRDRIEEHFARRNSQAMQAVLGIPWAASGVRRGTVAGRGVGTGRGTASAAGRGGLPVVPEDPELPFHLAHQLWGKASTEAFSSRLADTSRHDGRGHLLALCSAMPVETVRTALLTTLKAHHGDGPDALEKAGVPSEIVSDPGFVLVVKSLDRQEPQTPTTGRPATRGRPQPPAGRAVDSAGLKWMKYSETLVRSWCGRLDAAAHAHAENARLAGKDPKSLRRLEDLPIQLHEGAVVQAAYHLVLPSSAADKLSGTLVGPTRIQYVRIEERTSIKRMVGYYQRIARVRSGRQVADGIWFDAYRPPAASGVRCSLDVFIRLPEKKGARDIDLEADQNMIIEVLSIEAREP